MAIDVYSSAEMLQEDINITAEELLRDIYQAAAMQRWYEQKYGLLSETFYRLYHAGMLRDENPEEIQEYLEWAGWCEVYQDRRRRYNQAIERQLEMISIPASLHDLHVDKLVVSN